MKKNICTGTISSLFGRRRDPMKIITWHLHNGVDIACAIGTPIYSPIDAYVHSVFLHNKGGKTMILRNTKEEIRLGFCHLNKFCVAVSSSVKKGQLIAHSGNTGVSTGAHLHFTLKIEGGWSVAEDEYVGGVFADPTPYIEFDI